MSHSSDPPIRLAILGLDSGFFCDAFVQWCRLFPFYPWVHPPFPKVEITAASTLGVSEEDILNNLETSSQAFGKKYQLRIYETAEELFEKEQPHGVFVCGRPSRLPTIARLAIERGIHAFIQKPAGTKERELLELAAEADRRGVTVCAGQTWRHDGGAQTSLKRLRAEENEIGKLCQIRLMYQHGMAGIKTWYHDPSEGGPELWLAWYAIDLLHYFTKSKIKKLFATAHSGGSPLGVEKTIFHAACAFENGVNGSLDFYGNINYPYPRTEWELLTERGMIRNLQHNHIEIFGQGRDQKATYQNLFFDGIGQDINAWLHRWNGIENDSITLTEAAENVRISNAITESVATGTAICL